MSSEMQAITVILDKNLAPADEKVMYRHTEKQLELEGFHLPFSGELSADNRWVRLAQMIPWHKFEDEYCASLSKKGSGATGILSQNGLGGTDH